MIRDPRLDPQPGDEVFRGVGLDVVKERVLYQGVEHVVFWDYEGDLLSTTLHQWQVFAMLQNPGPD